MRTTLPKFDVVLWGLGHTNAHVLRQWRMQPIANARLTCVSNFGVATYSGMLPGVLAGQYPTERMEIDLVRLCAAAGARLIIGDVVGLDAANQKLQLADRPAVAFDVLSIGIGSVPTRAGVKIAPGTVLEIKPMQTFLARLDDRLRRHDKAVPLRIVVVGGGVGGVEIAFCLPAHIGSVPGQGSVDVSLVTATESVPSGGCARLCALVRKKLAERGVAVHLQRRVAEVDVDRVVLDDGQQLPSDLVIWATGAAAPPALSRLGLPTDEQGFLQTRTTLQTTADFPVFAVGDSGTMEGRAPPKAGVYAVRQGPFLWENIGRLLSDRPLVSYHPQRNFLKLLNTGDGRAIGEYHGFAFSGRWAWRLKNRIDGRFLDMYQDYRPMPLVLSEEPAPMRCLGCGGKVGGSVLSRVLERLDIPASDQVLVGLGAPDDAAVLQIPAGRPVTATVDFFAAPLDDPYLVGRITALHAASDVWAMGAKPVAALAMITIPVGPERQQESLLHDLLCGSLEELRRMGATLAGGHTIEGPQLTVGFTILADQGLLRTRGGLRLGDRLVLTKPLGSGILLAAHMRAMCRATWLQPLVDTLLTSNQTAALCAGKYNVVGMTDVTGFGLAGHLVEMLRAPRVAAVLTASTIPLLPGVAELLGQNIESTLAPANRAAEAVMTSTMAVRGEPAYMALFDPQTNGGLLLGVAEHDVADLLNDLGPVARVIGHVVAPIAGEPILRVT
jgi:selenide,water dikinase